MMASSPATPLQHWSICIVLFLIKSIVRLVPSLYLLLSLYLPEDIHTKAAEMRLYQDLAIVISFKVRFFRSTKLFIVNSTLQFVAIAVEFVAVEYFQ